MKKKIIDVLRWIALLPAACIGALLANVMVVVGNWTTTNYLGGRSILTDIFVFALGAILTGYGFVSAGYYVAPHYKRQTSLVLCALLSVVCGVSLTLGFVMHGFCWDSFKTALACVISIGAAIYTYSDLDELEE